ncbi:MAG: transcription-repair coupling factor [Phycisphaerales bacterium]|nr:transcription-repair coupling factor [Phycisphaerales bacterium]
MTASAWYEWMDASEAAAAADLHLSRGQTVGGRGGSSTVMLVAAAARRRSVPRVLLTAHLDQADEAVEELRAQGLIARRFPALETLPGESSARSDLLAERLSVIRDLSSDEPFILVAPIAAFMQPIPTADRMGVFFRTILKGDRIDLIEFATWMTDASWDRAATVERPGEFAIRGDVVDVFPEIGDPVRIDLFDDVVESLHAIDLDTMGSSHRLERVDLVTAGGRDGQDDDQEHLRLLVDVLDESWEAIIDDPAEVREQGRAYADRVAGGGWIADADEVQARLVNRLRAVAGIVPSGGAADLHIPVGQLPPFPDQAAEAVDDIRRRAQDRDVIIICRQEGDVTRVRELLGNEVSRVTITGGSLHRGFIWDEGDRAFELVSYDEVVHRYQVRRSSHAASKRRDLDAFVEIAPGDHVVHRDHGIATFLGLELKSRHAGVEEGTEEFLVLEFAQSARLLVPASDIEQVHRYIGAVKATPERSILGGKAWANRKGKAAESVRDLAAELLRIQAVRQGRQGMSCPEDGTWQHEFESSFPWEETTDQRNAFDAVRADMQKSEPMDRLVCGDVGFGKTEIAIRAAFRAVAAGRQVAVLVPTTVLAEQHARTFSSRFAGFPFRVESMSRFKTGAEQREILEGLASGDVDVLIGTHRLLSADVHFKDLGLVVIDEEQRFGVEHKQRLLQLRATVDVLTMTATPIPRTLHMSMMGLRDISSLQTAPVDRRAVVTEVMPWNKERLRRALQREFAREGQAFVVHNRVSDLDDIAEAIHELVPDARILTGHGQMSAKALERTMLAFMRHEADVLVSTTIIESGIDIPNANTMIINEADRFGLADLHQLRGRVGRSRHRAYCYLLLPMNRTVNPDARRRLQAVEAFAMLGAGFRIALRDLELRGAGNLLGPEQSGHIAAVGYEMYCRLLETAVADLREGRSVVPQVTVIDVGWSGWFPEPWIPSVSRRLDAYRRLSRATDLNGVEQVMEDLHSAYGEIPEPARRLHACRRLAIVLAGLGIRSLIRRERDFVLQTPRPSPLLATMRTLPGVVRRVGETSSEGLCEVWWRPPESLTSFDHVVELLCESLSTGSTICTS